MVGKHGQLPIQIIKQRSASGPGFDKLEELILGQELQDKQGRLDEVKAHSFRLKQSTCLDGLVLGQELQDYQGRKDVAGFNVTHDLHNLRAQQGRRKQGRGPWKGKGCGLGELMGCQHGLWVAWHSHLNLEPYSLPEGREARGAGR